MNAEQTTFLNIFGEGLDPTNRWMVLKDLVPWDELEQALSELTPDDRSPAGRPPLPARIALGALIIKEALGLTDRETVMGPIVFRGSLTLLCGFCYLFWFMELVRAR